MSAAERRIPASLDEDRVRSDEAPSGQTDVAVEIERRRRHRRLTEMLDTWERQRAPVDESLIDRFIGLFP